MDKFKELEKLKAKVATMKKEIIPEAQSEIDNISQTISGLFDRLTDLATTAKLFPTVKVGGGQPLVFDGEDWCPHYSSDWYSSSADC